VGIAHYLIAFVTVAALPTPQPAPPTAGPFSLASPGLPTIVRVRSRALCTALRQAVLPGVQAAMTHDAAYADGRAVIHDYTIFANDDTRPMRIQKLDRLVHTMVENSDKLQAAVDSPLLKPPSGATADDAAAMNDLHRVLSRLLDAQKVQLDVTSGFTESERTRLFAAGGEAERAMRSAVGQPGSTPAPMQAFLQDHHAILPRDSRGEISLSDASLLDDDLRALARMTSRREDEASQVILKVTPSCKPAQDR
jgi:hypothetical protein